MAKKHESETEDIFEDEPTPKANHKKSTTHPASEAGAEPKAENRQPTLEIVGEQVAEGKNQTRLFQTGPFQKTWLTKAQALEQKHYWKDED
jgi:hypothetical protein